MLLTILGLLVLGQDLHMMRPPISRVELRKFSPAAGTCRFAVDVVVGPGRVPVRPRAAKAGEVIVGVSSGRRDGLLTRATSSDETLAVDDHGRAVVELPTKADCLLTVATEGGTGGLLPAVFCGPPGAYEVVVNLSAVSDLEGLLPYEPKDLDEARAIAAAMPLIEAWLRRSAPPRNRQYRLSMARDADGNNVEVSVVPVDPDARGGGLVVKMKRDFTSPVAVEDE